MHRTPEAVAPRLDLSVIFSSTLSMADCSAHLEVRFDPFRCVLQDVGIDLPSPFFSDYDHSRATEEEHAFLVSASKCVLGVGLLNLADTRSPDFDIRELAEVHRLQDGYLPFINHEDIIAKREGPWVDGV